MSLMSNLSSPRTNLGTSDVAVIGAGFAGWGFLSAVFKDFLAAAIGEFTAGGYTP
jgi:hypothetical protein